MNSNRTKERLNLGLLLLVFLVCLAQPIQSYSPQQIINVTVYDAVKLIKQQSGSVLLLLVYKSDCSLSQRAFPGFVKLADKYQGKIAVLAFSDDVNIETTKMFLALNYPALPFQPYRIIPWKPGEFGDSMATVGIKIGQTFMNPIIAIFDRGNNVAAQGQGVTDIGSVEETLKNYVN